MPTNSNPGSVSRAAGVGAITLGFAGVVAGLIIGLFVYAPTAWFAALELGIPAAAIGALVGAAVGAVINRKSSGTA